MPFSVVKIREKVLRIQKCLVMVGCIFSFFVITSGCYTEDVYLTTSEYLPYTTEHAENYGFCSEIVGTVIKKMNMNPIHKFYPWIRGQLNVRDGKVWATFPYSKNPEREREYWFSAQPLFVGRVSFFCCKDCLSENLRWNTLEDLKQYKIGGVRGYWYEGDFAKAGLAVEYTDHPEESLKKLYSGRIQLFPLNEIVGWYLIDRLFPGHKDRFCVLAKSYELSPSYLMVSKFYPNSERLLKRFDEAFRRLKESGGYRNILKKNGILYSEETY